MGVRSYMMAKFYDASVRKTEVECLGAWRADLLQDVGGDVLEIGSGTGVNVPYYSRNINRLVLSEPEPHMRKILQKKIGYEKGNGIELAECSGEALSFADNSFDAVVSTLVMCSVRDQVKTLSELKRVLRPQGRMLFLEHVAALDNPKIYKWQKFFEPIWKFCAGNCHLTRNTSQAIADAGFHIEKIDHVHMTTAPAIVRPVIKGVVVKGKQK